MERLTYRLNGQCDNPTDSIILKPYLRYEDTETRKKILNRLAAYEDSGLEPEDLKKAFNETAILKLAAQALSTTPDHLRDLLQAEQDEQLVVLPCKLGDDVWFVRKFGKGQCIKRAEVSCINIDFRGEVFVSARRISGGYIGKTVFLTREEAEAALKGGEG